MSKDEKIEPIRVNIRKHTDRDKSTNNSSPRKRDLRKISTRVSNNLFDEQSKLGQDTLGKKRQTIRPSEVFISKAFLSDAEEMGAYHRYRDEAEPSSLNSSQRLIRTTSSNAISHEQLLSSQFSRPESIVYQNPTILRSLIAKESNLPDQVIAENMYINFKFLEFVTAYFTFLSKTGS
jgi:hypothetical protein